MQSKTAVIIKGNPDLITKNPKADKFYSDLELFVSDLGYTVQFDLGEPYTTPSDADVWIGHSRGADRLRFAPKDTVVIGIGVPQSEEENNFPVVNHPDDEMVKLVYQDGKIVKNDTDKKPDDTYHYVLSDEMKKKIKNILE